MNLMDALNIINSSFKAIENLAIQLVEYAVRKYKLN